MCCIIKEVLHTFISEEEEHIHFSREKVRRRTKTLRMPPRVFPSLSKALLPSEDSVVAAAVAVAVATAATAVVDEVAVVVVLDVVDVSAVVVFVVA